MKTTKLKKELMGLIASVTKVKKALKKKKTVLIGIHNPAGCRAETLLTWDGKLRHLQGRASTNTKKGDIRLKHQVHCITCKSDDRDFTFKNAVTNASYETILFDETSGVNIVQLASVAAIDSWAKEKEKWFRQRYEDDSSSDSDDEESESEVDDSEEEEETSEEEESDEDDSSSDSDDEESESEEEDDEELDDSEEEEETSEEEESDEKEENEEQQFEHQEEDDQEDEELENDGGDSDREAGPLPPNSPGNNGGGAAAEDEDDPEEAPSPQGNGGFDHFDNEEEADEPLILPRNNDRGGGGDDDSYVDNNDDVFHDALETLRDGEDDNVNVKIPANNNRNNNVARMGRGRKLLPVATATTTTIVGIVTLLLCPFVGDIIGIKNPLFGSSIKTNSSLSAQLEAKEKRPTHDIKEEQTKAAAEEIMIVTPENDDNGSDVEALFIYLVIHKCTDIHQSMFNTTDVSDAHIEIQSQDKVEDTSKSEAGLPSSSSSSSSQPSSHPSVQPTTTAAPSSVPSSNPMSSGVPSLMVSCLFRSSKSAHIMCQTSLFNSRRCHLTKLFLSLAISITAV